MPFDVRVHDVATVDEYAFEQNGRHLERAALSAKALDQLALLELATEADQTVGATARQLGVKASIEVLRHEATISG